VMYVLPRADQPERYGGLPADPRISPFVGVWKGTAKIAGLALMGLAVVASFFHYITVGPDDVAASAEDGALALKQQLEDEAAPPGGRG
jgi:formate dehydrogenase iron-sulfur subunit